MSRINNIGEQMTINFNNELEPMRGCKIRLLSNTGRDKRIHKQVKTNNLESAIKMINLIGNSPSRYVNARLEIKNKSHIITNECFDIEIAKNLSFERLTNELHKLTGSMLQLELYKIDRHATAQLHKTKEANKSYWKLQYLNDRIKELKKENKTVKRLKLEL